MERRSQSAGHVLIAVFESVQKSRDIGHPPHRITAPPSARQRVAGLELPRTRSWAVQLAPVASPRERKVYTRKSSARSGDDEPTRDRGCHPRETARHRPRAAPSASFGTQLPRNPTARMQSCGVYRPLPVSMLPPLPAWTAQTTCRSGTTSNAAMHLLQHTPGNQPTP
jgi:hypothetical protein